MKMSTVAFAAFLAASQVHGALEPPTTVYPRGDELGTKVIARQEKKPTQKPSTVPIPGSPTSQGCYNSAGNMSLHEIKDMSSGSCYEECKGKGFWVSGLHGQDCYCGFVYPPVDAIAKDQSCDYPCPAYPLEVCGGLPKSGFPSGLWSIFNLGVNVAVQPLQVTSSTSSSATRPTDPTNSDDPGSGPAAVTPTRQSSPSSSSDADKKSGPNTAGIAAGSVVGVVVVAAIVGGIFLYMRRKRNAEIEEEHRRNAAVSAFINGSKPPGSSGSISMTDARLDPVMANRRMSDGSIADNEDYSRRILRVTNA